MYRFKRWCKLRANSPTRYQIQQHTSVPRRTRKLEEGCFCIRSSNPEYAFIFLGALESRAHERQEALGIFKSSFYRQAPKDNVTSFVRKKKMLIVRLDLFRREYHYHKNDDGVSRNMRLKVPRVLYETANPLWKTDLSVARELILSLVGVSPSTMILWKLLFSLEKLSIRKLA